jgi:tetratricopeptide (TPR) repeat protein
MANYYLGNQWYAFKEYAKARECWEKSKALNPHFPILRRNLALAYYNKFGLFTEALHEMENAFHLDPTDSRVLMELDQLKKKMNVKLRVRLNFLEQLFHSIESRDDLYLEYVTLQNQIGNHEKALNLLMNHKFHPWEGGEGKVTGQYVLSHISLAKQLFIQGNYLESLAHLEASECYPENLGEGKLIGNQDNEINYWKGNIASALGNNDLANGFYNKAIQGDTQPSNAVFYNDQKPDVIFYQGLALRKLGRSTEAHDRFQTLLEYAEKHRNDHIIPDYFAVSLPDMQIWEENLDIINTRNCTYLKSLALIGIGEFEEARKELSILLQADYNHQGAISHLQLLETGLMLQI